MKSGRRIGRPSLAGVLLLLTLAACGDEQDDQQLTLAPDSLRDALVIRDVTTLTARLPTLVLPDPQTDLRTRMMTAQEFADALAGAEQAASDACLRKAFGTDDVRELRELLGYEGGELGLEPQAALAAWAVYRQCMQDKGFATSALGPLGHG